MIDSSTGPTSKGTCQICSAEKEFKNSLDELPPFTIVKEGNMPARKYDDRKEEIIAAFIKSGRNVAATAKEMGIPEGGTLYGLLYRWKVMERPVRKPRKLRKQRGTALATTATPLGKDKPIPGPRLRGSATRQRGKELERVRSRAHELWLHNTKFPALKKAFTLRRKLEKEFPELKLPGSTISTWCRRWAVEDQSPKGPVKAMADGADVLKSLIDSTAHRLKEPSGSWPVQMSIRQMTMSVDADNKTMATPIAEFLYCANRDLAKALRDTLMKDMRLDG